MAATLRRGGLISTPGVFVAITLAVAAVDTLARAGSPEKSALAGLSASSILKKFAGDVFDLDPFFLQIPLDDDDDGCSDIVAMPLLRNFEDPAFFHIDKGRVRLRRGIDEIAEWPLEASGLQFRGGVVYGSESSESGDPESVAEVTIWKLYLVHQ
jgi:hypothetical protein